MLQDGCRVVPLDTQHMGMDAQNAQVLSTARSSQFLQRVHITGKHAAGCVLWWLCVLWGHGGVHGGRAREQAQFVNCVQTDAACLSAHVHATLAPAEGGIVSWRLLEVVWSG